MQKIVASKVSVNKSLSHLHRLLTTGYKGHHAQRSVMLRTFQAGDGPDGCCPSFRPPRAEGGGHPQRFRRINAGAGQESIDRVQQGDYVEIHYTGTLDDGSEFDSSRNREPLAFMVGANRVVPGFERMVLGMELGETKSQRIPPSDAYGDWSDGLTANVPKANAPQGLQEGAVVQLQNGMQATVTKIDDEFVSIDANHPLAGKHLTFDVELCSLIKSSKIGKATFGAGCFWGVELSFQRIPGVLSTEVGYSQGPAPNPTYEEVCSGTSGHAEVVQVLYNEDALPYETLLDVFFDKHDPTTLNRQGNDVGEQYRSGIYYHTDAQKQAAEKAIALQNEKYSGQVVTEIEEIKNYSRAEEYHQQYLEKGGRFGRPQSAAKGCTDPIRCYG